MPLPDGNTKGQELQIAPEADRGVAPRNIVQREEARRKM